jgi:undecaprenyl-diphosphatase
LVAKLATIPSMTDLLSALLLGIIEGITEFLPVSSTGHLLIAEHWLGARSDLFNIAIQAGAILAVVAIYWQRLWSLLVGFAQKSNRDYALKLIVAFLVTGVLGLAVKKLGFQLPETLAPIAWAMLVGGFVILGVEAIDARRADLSESDPEAIGWGTAVLVGLAQVLAGVFPGTSRSAAAIFAALLFGRSSRVAATEFAFLVGIPTMFAASGYELLHTLKDGGSAGEDWTALGVAFVVSAIVAFIAVKWLLRYIQTHRFTVFAWYRIVLGAALLAWVYAGAASPIGAAQAATPAASAPQDIARFREAKLCVQAAMYRNRSEDESDENPVASADDPNFSPEERAYQHRELRAIDETQERARVACPKSDAGALDGSIYELALRAADAGDRQAASCYASGAFPIPQKLWDEPAFQAQLRENTQRLLDRGVQAGDWSMVGLAALRYSPRRRPFHHQQISPAEPVGDQAMMSLFDTAGDVERAYRVTWLMKLGTGHGMGRWGDEGYLNWLGKQLTEEQRKAGQAWAEETMARSFSNRPYNWTDMEPCPYQQR